MEFHRAQSGPLPLLIGIAIPLGLLAVAYALWAISDRLLYVGPLDRAAFGWIVVMPISWVAPGVTGLVWSRLSVESRVSAALVVGGTVAIASGVLLALAGHQIGCAPVISWTDNLPRSLVVGVVIGLGPAVAALVAASVSSGSSGLRRIVATIATGAIIGFVGLFAALMTFALLFPGVSCAPVPS
jgi:hypothetical protein